MPSSGEESTDEKITKAFDLLNSDAPVQLLLDNDEAERLKALDQEVFKLIKDICERRRLTTMQCRSDLHEGDPLKSIRQAIIYIEKAIANPRHLAIISPR